jgi:hypothetical protein
VLGGESFPERDYLLRVWPADSKTALFNIYGTTEASCWASLREVCRADLDSPHFQADIGDCLPGAEFQVDDGANLSIGGAGRLCFLPDTDPPEVFLAAHAGGKGIFRPTGDIVRREPSGALLWAGRSDRQIKRGGARLQLEDVEHRLAAASESLGLRDFALCWIAEGQRLVLFAVPCSTTAGGSEEPLPAALLPALRGLLHHREVPDEIVLLRELPTSINGKVDRARLQEDYAVRGDARPAPGERAESAAALVVGHCRALGLVVAPGSGALEARFQALGGDSISGLRLVRGLLEFFGVEDQPNLYGVWLDALLSRPLGTLVSLVAGFAPGRFAAPAAFRSQPEDLIAAAAAAADPVSIAAPLKKARPATVQMRVRWQAPLGKCVDARPLVVPWGALPHGAEVPERSAETDVVFIGSHAHNFVALLGETGERLWTQTLSDRVESSACLSACGRFVLVGCYDGGLYALEACTGRVAARLWTGDAIKSSPCVDTSSGHILVGSHDGFLHAFRLGPPSEVWRARPHPSQPPSPIFASPALDALQGLVVAATLAGTLFAANVASGAVLWTFEAGKPIFASPLVLPSGRGVVVGCVDGRAMCISVQDGTLLWSLACGAPIFSTPRQLGDSNVVFGCHDACLRCVRAGDGAVQWCVRTPSQLYAAPCVIQGPSGLLVLAASTSGALLVVDEHGHVDGELLLPGEVFSAAAAGTGAGGCVVAFIGCRDDQVYSVGLNTYGVYCGREGVRLWARWRRTCRASAGRWAELQGHRAARSTPQM